MFRCLEHLQDTTPSFTQATCLPLYAYPSLAWLRCGKIVGLCQARAAGRPQAGVMVTIAAQQSFRKVCGSKVTFSAHLLIPLELCMSHALTWGHLPKYLQLLLYRRAHPLSLSASCAFTFISFRQGNAQLQWNWSYIAKQCVDIKCKQTVRCMGAPLCTQI